MTEFGNYLEKFSETGQPVFESALESARKRAQYHIAEGHIIAALFEIDSKWAARTISRKGAMPEQIKALAEKEIENTKPFTKGGIKIHPSANVFFRQSMKFAEAGGRTQIDYVDLIAVLDLRIEDLIKEQREFDPALIRVFRRLKSFFRERRRLQ